MNYTQKNKMIDKLCGAFLMLIGVEIFYGVVRSAYTEFNYPFAEVTKWINISGGVALAAGIALLVIAYKKNNWGRAVYGLELVAMSFTAATLPGSYLSFPAPFNKLNVVFPLAFLGYYVIKSIYIIIDANKDTSKSKKKKRRG